MAARRRPARHPARPKAPPTPDERTKLPEISASLTEFAQPILRALPASPTLEQMQQAMMIAQTAWNLPLVEDQPGAKWKKLRELYDRQMQQAPESLRFTMDLLVRLRRARWGNDPRIVTGIEVIPESKEFRL